MMWMFAGCLLIGGFSAEASNEPVEEAVLFDITQTGLDLGLGVALGILPESLEIPGIASGCASDCGWGTCFEEDYFGVFDGLVSLEPVSATATGNADGVLRVLVELSVSLNDSANPFLLEYDAFCFAGACDAWIDPFPVYARIDLAIVEVMTDAGLVVAPQVIAVDISYPVTDDDLNISGCSLDTLRDIAGFFGLSVTDLALGAVDAQLNTLLSQIDGLNASLAAFDLFSVLRIDESFELTEGVALDLALGLTEVAIDEGGLRLALFGGADVGEAAPCVAAYDTGGALWTPSDAPTLGEMNLSDPFPHGGALHVADDFVNQVLYAAWKSGLLCQTLDDELIGDTLPIGLDTRILPLFVGESFDVLFPEPKPVAFQLDPSSPPVVDFAAESMGLRLDDLGFAVLTELEDRKLRLVQADLGLPVGFDVGFDTDLGAVSMAVDLSGGAEALVTYNEYMPGAEQSVEEALGGLFAQPLVTGLVDSLAGDISFGLPPIAFGDANLGVQDLRLEAAGPELDWMSSYAAVGEVPYTKASGCSGGASGCVDAKGCEDTTGCLPSEGCDLEDLGGTKGCEGKKSSGVDDCGGCSEPEACDGGCSVSGGLQSRAMGAAFVLVFSLMRRREREV